MKEKNKNMEQIGKALDDEMLQEVIGGIRKVEERRPEPKKPRKGGGSKKTLIGAEGET